MHADAEKLLWDARLATDRIARFIAGKAFDDCHHGDYMRAAVARHFEISSSARHRPRRWPR